MKAQLELDYTKASEARNQGIDQSISHANEVNPGWSEKAYNKLKEFLTIFSDPFQAEEVRSFAAVDDEFPDPPNNRSWGGVFLKAANAGLIRKIGSQNTKAVKSHCTPAALWEKV